MPPQIILLSLHIKNNILTIKKQRAMKKQELKESLRNRSNEELREAMVILYTAKVPNHEELVELGNIYAEVLKERGEELA